MGDLTEEKVSERSFVWEGEVWDREVEYGDGNVQNRLATDEHTYQDFLEWEIYDYLESNGLLVSPGRYVPGKARIRVTVEVLLTTEGR